MRSRIFCGVIFSALLLPQVLGCRNGDYLYLSNPAPRETRAEAFSFKELVPSDWVDILWVVDNHPSMQPFQASLGRDSRVVFNQLKERPGLKWKMGLISTDEKASPYVGFGSVGETSTDELNDSTGFPENIFADAVARLGAHEPFLTKSLDSTLGVLRRFPRFLRPGSTLVLVIVADAPDRSGLSAAEFLRDLSAYKNRAETVVYGIFGSTDLGCQGTGEAWNFSGSSYEALIQATGGKAYSICRGELESALGNMTKEISTKLRFPRLFLENRPKSMSIRVFYRGDEIPSGMIGKSGFWHYDYELNAILFHNLSFAEGVQESIQVTYDVDHGE